MQIGGSLFLLAVGAILAFAVRDAVDAVDLTMIGYILIVVGAIGLALSLILNSQRRGRDEPPPRY
ncbi:DUF6458 family protein [Aeromicrobium sp. Sec7.5]|uniref:DUF6458 family protein n=1 Tax=Aeromicrobium sp. Sec7.5 TaxID=3121276 RepID=UPI002FE46439